MRNLHYAVVLGCVTSNSLAGSRSASISVSATQWFEATPSILQTVNGAVSNACLAASAQCNFSGSATQGGPCADGVGGSIGASGFPLSLSDVPLNITPPDCCRFELFVASPYAMIHNRPQSPGQNQFEATGSLVAQYCLNSDGSVNVDSQTQNYTLVNAKANYSIQSGLSVAIKTTITATVTLSPESDCGQPPAYGVDFEGLLCFIEAAIPSGRFLTISVNSGSVSSRGWNVDLMNAGPGSYTLTATYSELTNGANPFETGVVLSVQNGSVLDVFSDGEINCKDLADIQSHINQGIPVLSIDQIQRLNVNCMGNEADAIDCDDLFTLTQIVVKGLQTCDLGDANADELYDWCDMALLTQAIMSQSADLCESEYNVLVDMNLDRTLDALDQQLLMPLLPVQRVLGDADANGLINQSDITAVLAAFGQSGPPWFIGDANGDGLANFADITAITTNFNRTACDF